MDSRNEIRDFLISRRARITPEQAGLPVYGGNRRVSGLRREEVAMLAGVSVDYYIRMERGNARGVSDSVLENLARALHLDEAERAHLYDLARAANNGARAPRRPARQQVRPAVQRLLDAMTMAPVYVRNGRMDVLAANRLGRALFAPLFGSPAKPTNMARFIFLDPAAPAFYQEWDRLASDTVALLRAEAGRNPTDRGLSDLIGELSTRSDIFRIRWADHNVRQHRSGNQALPPPGRRRHQPGLRVARARRRPRPGPQRLQRRAWHRFRGRAEPARQLGGHDRSGTAGALGQRGDQG